MEELLSDPTVLEPPLAMPTPSPRRPTAPPTRSKASPNQETPWRDIDLFFFEYPETPFKLFREETTNLENQYFRLVHITLGVSMALDNYRPENILRELTKEMHRSNVDAPKTKKAQLVAQVAAMAQKLAQKSEEIQRYKGKTDGGPEPSLGLGRISRHNCQQRPILRQTDGECGAFLSSTDLVDFSYIFKVDEGFV